MTDSIMNGTPEVSPIEIVSAEPIEVHAWSRYIIFTHKGKQYDVTQWYDEDNGTSFTGSGSKLDLDELFDDPGMEIDTLADNWLEDHKGNS